MQIFAQGAVTKAAVLATVALAAIFLWMPRAVACKVASPTPHVIDPQAAAVDTTAPGEPIVSVAGIKRGKGPHTEFGSCSQSSTSCDDMGTIDLQVSAQDDQSPADKLGYQIELTAGALPEGITLPAGAVRPTGKDFYLAWNDGNTDDQEALQFSLAIRAVDLAGNVGPAATVQIRDGGSGKGCHVAARASLSGWPLATVGLLLAARLVRAIRARKRRR